MSANALLIQAIIDHDVEGVREALRDGANPNCGKEETDIFESKNPLVSSHVQDLGLLALRDYIEIARILLVPELINNRQELLPNGAMINLIRILQMCLPR